jgi:ribosomal peptide maturation radical SAM protein 1
MPWATPLEPSLGLAILKAQLNAENIESRIFHLNIRLLRYLTAAVYKDLAICYAFNEFVFTSVIDELIDQGQADCMMDRCLAHTNGNLRLTLRSPADFGKILIRVRHEAVPEYLAACAEEILAYQPTMVGFTCLFDQTMASVALATLIRESMPNTLIVLGGYALEGPPGVEVLRAFPQIDAVAVGDGEPVVGPLARASIGEVRLQDIPGVLTRNEQIGRPRASYDIEASPIPDYSDWFRDVADLKSKEKITINTVVLPVESSRGCWWGQRHHCTFCGIDDATLSYRQKKTETVLTMLDTLRSRHGQEFPFRFSDYILPHSYWKDLLPKLAETKPRYSLTCEIKANQTETHIKALADAGFSAVQPGIESFDSNVLKLMDKGVTGIQNVHLLKLGYLYGIVIDYNILYGFPDELAEWYVEMVARIPRLYHFTPPVTRTEVIVTRFAPLYEYAKFNGLPVKPAHHNSYDALFSKAFINSTGFSLDNFAYYFKRYFKHEENLLPLYQELRLSVDRWKRQHHLRDVHLSYRREGSGLVVSDSRFGEAREFQLDAVQADVYLACDEAPRAVKSLSTDHRTRDLSTSQVADNLDFLDSENLIWREGDRVLGLAVPESIARRHQLSNWKRSWSGIFV